MNSWLPDPTEQRLWHRERRASIGFRSAICRAQIDAEPQAELSSMCGTGPSGLSRRTRQRAVDASRIGPNTAQSAAPPIRIFVSSMRSSSSINSVAVAVDHARRVNP